MNSKKIFTIISSIAIIFIVVMIGLLIGNKKPITHNIIFETNGGSIVESQIVNDGDKIKKPNDPIKEGYKFIGWMLDNEIYDFNLEVTSDLTLTAKWIEIDEEETFVVKFNTSGGSTIQNQIVKKGEKIEKPTEPIKEGYKFIGWMLDNKIYDFESSVSSDIELKAKWEKTNEIDKPITPNEKKYTVTFDSKGGSTVKSQTVVEGNKVTKPTEPTRSGYTFAGWTLNGSNYDFNSTVTGNITLVAKWTENIKNNYTVTFDSKGGSTVKSQTVVEGNKVTKPIDPTKSGYTFAGWTLNGSNYDFNSTVTGNITLVAKWTAKSYTVKVAPVDQYSPDRILTVYENGTQISVSAIKYNGVTLCSGSNMVVNMYEISGISSVTVVLTNGSSVTASVQQ